MTIVSTVRRSALPHVMAIASVAIAVAATASCGSDSPSSIRTAPSTPPARSTSTVQPPKTTVTTVESMTPLPADATSTPVPTIEPSPRPTFSQLADPLRSRVLAALHAILDPELTSTVPPVRTATSGGLETADQTLGRAVTADETETYDQAVQLYQAAVNNRLVASRAQLANIEVALLSLLQAEETADPNRQNQFCSNAQARRSDASLGSHDYDALLAELDALVPLSTCTANATP